MSLTINTHKLFSDTAEMLSDADLMRVRSEAFNTLQYAVGLSDDETYRPGAMAWYGYEIALCVYGTVIGGEIYLRHIAQYDIWGFARISTDLHKEGYEMALPPWLADTDVLQSNRSYLVRYYPKEYRKMYKSTPPDWPVLWPRIDEDDLDKYDLLVAKAERKLIKNLPKSVRKRVANAK